MSGAAERGLSTGAEGRSDMTRIKRATIVLPLVVLLLGVLVPVLLERDEEVRASDAEAAEARVSGRTAGEWAAEAMQAMAEGRWKRALSSIKTAESVEAGTQYATELKSIRRARWRASEAARLADRMIGGDADYVAFDAFGAVVAAHRLVTVLPGESLWTLATDMVAAMRRVPAADVPDDDRDVYRMWDSLTAMNGVRELEVGERVRVPLLPRELVVLAAANRRDLDRVAAAIRSSGVRRHRRGGRLRGELEGAFVESTSGFVSLDGPLNAAIRERHARLELDREHALVEDARTALARIPELPRTTHHSERLAVLNGAHAALSEAEALRSGAQYQDAFELVERLLSEETRFGIGSDGAVIAAKPAGVRYTDAARQVVEWTLERELRSSGKQLPELEREVAGREGVGQISCRGRRRGAEERSGLRFPPRGRRRGDGTPASRSRQLLRGLGPGRPAGKGGRRFLLKCILLVAILSGGEGPGACRTRAAPGREAKWLTGQTRSSLDSGPRCSGARRWPTRRRAKPAS